MSVVRIMAVLQPGETQEKLIKRFFKKCKKDDIVKEYAEKTSYFEKKSQKKHSQVMRVKWLRRKIKENEQVK